MKKKYSLILMAFLCSFFFAYAQTPWINEIHYDNTGADTDEGVEVAIPSGYTYDALTFRLVGYNGSTTQTYANVLIDPFVAGGNTVGGVTFVWVPISDLQNGAPDGVALAEAGLIQFLSYEGSFTASNGVANGTTSTDIGVAEATSSAIGNSLQLQGTGCQYSDFTWSTSIAHTNNDVNTSQTISCSSTPTIVVNPTSLTGFTYVEGSGPSGVQSFVVSGSNLTDDIDVTPPTNWEISTSMGGPYQTTALSYTPVSGTVTNQTIYTRMVSGLLNSGSPYSGNITAVSLLDGITENVAVDGTVTLPSSCSPIFSDNFAGGLGSWTEGNVGDWTTSGGELKHNLSSVEDESYIYTDIGAQNLNAGNYEWEFCIRNDNWDPSGSNRFAFFLLSDDSNLQTSGTGYAVGVNMSGTADDLLTLYEVTNDSYTEIIESSFNWDANDDVCIRVTRNTSGDWELLYNENGNGEVSGGTITDNTHSTGNYIGQFFDFTSTRAGLLWVDDVSVCSDIVISGPEFQLVVNSADENCGYTLDFGNVESNGSTLDLSIFVQNDGSSALDINSLTVADNTYFDVVSPTAGFPISVSPGNSQEIVIRFTATVNGTFGTTLTIANTDASDANDETSCVVNLSGTGVTNSGTGDIIITQYYEGSSNNKWIEIKNISGSAISANSYYIATYNQGPGPSYNERPLNGSPNQSVAIPAMASDEVIRFKEPSTTVPAYAVPGEAGYDGNNTEEMFSSSFSGDDIIVISPTNGSNCYINRIDMIGEYSANGTNWGDRRCFVRKECTASSPSTNFDINDWIEFTDAEVVNPANGTNPYLGEHYTGSTTFIAGAWNNGSPDRSRGVIISDDYVTSAEASFEACSLIITANNTLDITDGDYVGVQTDVTVNTNATLEIRNQGQLVQVEDTGNVTNNGTTNVRKTTASMNQYDYVYWSSPVDYGPPTPPLGIAFVLTEFLPNRMYRFNTATFEDDQPTADGDGFDDNQDDWVLHSSYMEPGIGYAAMTANTSAGVNNAVFSGIINNGQIDVAISLSGDGGGDSDGDVDDWNLVGNPYPSAISADSLVSQNTNIDGTLYFWTHNTPIAGIAGPDALNFSSNDYAMYNATGGVGTAASSGGAAPTGRIASGQGFFVDAVANGTLSFNNSMRNIAIANDDFFRSTSNSSFAVEKSRMWLNLTNPDGAYSQILIGYFDDATNFKDRLYDGVRIKGTNYIDFYSMDAGLMEYGIQGRNMFNEFDVVPLGYNSNITGPLSIELYQREGLLAEQTIYLKDNYLNVIHDLTSSAYVYEAQLGHTNDRFEILYNQDTLTNESNLVSTKDLIIYEQPDGWITFKLLGPYQFDTIDIVDLLGRTLYNLDGEAQTEKNCNLSGLSSATYLVRVALTDGQIITKKVIKKL